MVSGRVSPLLTELNWTPWVMGITLPPRRSMAPIKEALVRVLIDKKVIEPKELLEMMETVKKERYRHIEDK